MSKHRGRNVGPMRGRLDIKCRFLVRVLAISQRLAKIETEVKNVGKRCCRRVRPVDGAAEVTSDRLVVRSRAPESLEGKEAPICQTGSSLITNRGDQAAVLLG